MPSARRCGHTRTSWCFATAHRRTIHSLKKTSRTKPLARPAMMPTRAGTSANPGFRCPRSVLHVPSESNTVHHTQKPLALFEYLIKTYTKPGELVLDSCMGSGTTAIACLNTGRNFIGFELDPECFQAAQHRLRTRQSSL